MMIPLDLDIHKRAVTQYCGWLFNENDLVEEEEEAGLSPSFSGPTVDEPLDESDAAAAASEERE